MAAVQVLPVFVLRAIRVAATVPVLPVLPCATAHRPTFAAALVAAAVVVYFVDADVVIVSLVAVAEPDDGPRRVADTTIVDAVIAVTLPNVNPPKPARPAPCGRAPLRAPDGLPLGAPDGRAPDGRVPPPNPVVQEPAVAAVIATVVAGCDALAPAAVLDEPAAFLATALTQLPTLTADRVVTLASVNFVVEL
ncbi:hypothetical protein [uncultured Jatrophihabitans sp.]|uniref:hypothetical protein n=1 Tax=uncultured Jatrophihabitans sp. TaxID=1610747 RepID=UPI0035C95351